MYAQLICTIPVSAFIWDPELDLQHMYIHYAHLMCFVTGAPTCDCEVYTNSIVFKCLTDLNVSDNGKRRPKDLGDKK